MRRKFLLHVLLILLFCVFDGFLYGQHGLPEIRQITTHPQEDFEPAVSPDGKWLAFTSERSGNMDIWIKRLPRGSVQQVTTHQADDFHPVWSPDSKRLAFVSKRRDAQSDIWMVSVNLKRSGVPQGKPLQMTHYLGIDRNPSFSPEGNSLVFESDRTGDLNLWILNLKTKTSRPITFFGGSNPSWSPVNDWIVFTSFRFDSTGDLFLVNAQYPETDRGKEEHVFPVTRGHFIDKQCNWSPDGTSIVFSRHDTDTDGDDRLSPDDFSSLWQKELTTEGAVSPEKIYPGESEIQITTTIAMDAEPFWSRDGSIFFSTYRGGNLDIWEIPAGGIFPKQANALDQYSIVMERSGSFVTEEELLQSILGYQRVIDYFSDDSLWVNKSLIKIGETYQILEQPVLADRVFHSLTDSMVFQNRENLLAELKLASSSGEPTDKRINRCRKIINCAVDDPYTSAEAWIILGDIYLESGETGESLVAYNHVLRSYPELVNMRASAQIKIGDLLVNQGQTETARQNYLSALREYGNIPLWRKRASQRLMQLVEGTAREKIEGYQQIIQEAADLPSLMAEAQLAIGQILIDQKLYLQALRELEKVQQIAPTLVWAHAQAKILQAGIYGRLNDDLKGILLLEDVIKTYESVEGGKYKLDATAVLFDLLFQSAEKLKGNGDFALAEARYRKAVVIRPDDIRVYRGLAEAMYGRGRIGSLVHELEEKLDKKRDNAVLLYALGLAYSYDGEHQPDILLKSNVLLEQSLSEDYRLIYPYRTLSYNYELLEKLGEEKANQKRGFLTRTGRLLLSPFRWLFGLLPFDTNPIKRGYYEKAIDALITALELNDESTDSRMEALLAQNLANNFYNLGEFGYKKAYLYYQRRLSIDTTFSSMLEKAVFYERAGHCGTILEDIDKPEMFLQNAIAIYKHYGRDADVQRNLGMLAFYHQLAGNHEDAIAVYQQMVVWDEARGNWDNVELTYRNIAYNYHLMGEPEDAIEYAGKAEKLLGEKKDKISPPKKNTLRIELLGLSIPVWSMEEIGGSTAESLTYGEEKSLVYGLLSRNYEAVKTYHQAISYEIKRLDIFKKRKDHLSERVSLNRLGMLHYKSADYEAAWNYFFQSWEKNRKKKDEHGIWITAVNLGNVATVELSRYQDGHHANQALDCLNDALKFLSVKGQDFNLRKQMVLWVTQGAIRTLIYKQTVQSGQFVRDVQSTLQGINYLAEAENCFQNGLRLAQAGQLKKEEGIIYKNLAEVSERACDYETAYAFLNKSYSLLKKCGEEDLLWRILYALGNLTSQISIKSTDKNPDIFYQQAIEELESVPVLEEGSDEQLSDRNERWALYRDAAFEMARQGKPDRALEIVEKGREKQVADILARRLPELKHERHKIAWGNLRYIRTRLYEIQKKIKGSENSDAMNNDLKQWEDDYNNLETEYYHILKQLKEEDLVLAYLSGAEPVDLQTIQKTLPENGGALCYLSGTDETLLWVLDRSSIRSLFLDIGESELHGKISDFLHRIGKDSLTAEIGEELYNLLIKPVESFVDQKSFLLIVPDGSLWNVPLGVLSNGGDALIERVSLDYATSLMSYQLASERRKVNHEKGVVIGDVKDAVLLESMKNFVQSGKTLLGKDATEQAFLETIVESDLIQVERWMVLNDHDPLMSSLVLFSGDSDDGFLSASKLFSRNSRASLVTLPPFVNDLQGNRQTSHIFLHGLLYSGVPSVLISMWPVERDIKKLLMDSFYSKLNDLTVADALAEAQIVVRNRYPSMKNWGGFRLVGFEGMNREGRIRFAADHLVQTVRKARARYEMGDYIESVETLEQAVDMARTLKDSVTLQRLYSEIVYTSVQGRLWGKAATYQQIIYEGMKKTNRIDEMEKAAGYLSVFYQRNGEIEKAVQSKLEMIRFAEDTGEDRTLAGLYEDLAAIHAENRRYDDAVHWTDKACALYEQQNDSTGLARSFIRKGRFELENEKYWEAYENLQAGIVQSDRILMGTPDNPTVRIGKASAYQLLGLACEKLTRYDKALVFQQKGLALFSSLDRPVQVALAHQYLANIYWETGDYRNALDHQQIALNVFQSQNQAKLMVMAYGTQGLIFFSLGDLSKAKEAEQKALDLTEENLDLLEDRAAILKNLGLIAIQEDKPNGAYDFFRRASVIDSSLQSRRGLAYDYRNLGTLLVRMGRQNGGIQILNKGLELSREIGDRRNEAQCYYGLGLAFKEKNDLNTALQHVQDGLSTVSNLVVPEMRWRLYRLQADILAGLRKNDDALEAYRQAVEIVEDMRADLKVEAMKQGFIDDKMGLYEDIIQHLLGMKKTEDAFHFVERAKSRNFIDLLANQRFDLSHTSRELLDREKTVKESLFEAQERLVEIMHIDEPLSTTEKEEKLYWEEQRNRSRKEYEEVLAAIQTENSQLVSFVSVDPWQIGAVRAVLPDSSAIAEYFMTDQILFCFFVTKTDLKCFRVPYPESQIVRDVKQFRETLQARLSVDYESQQFYQNLIQPFEQSLDNISHLIFVPHGILHYLPFCAVQNKEGRSLVETFSVSYAPSATVFGYCSERKKELQPLGNNPKILALSNPDIGDPAYNLPFAGKEVTTLKRTFQNITVLSGRKATEDAVRKQIGSYDVVHFACHGSYEQEAPLFSSLLLSPENGNDGRLEAHEIFGLHLNCGLVTLSACETGLARITKGDEIIGLARSFIFAGTPSIMTSLWKVDDLATAVLIKRFYRYLADGDAKAEALRKAQLLVREQVDRHPSAWAAFGLTGDFQ